MSDQKNVAVAVSTAVGTDQIDFATCDIDALEHAVIDMSRDQVDGIVITGMKGAYGALRVLAMYLNESYEVKDFVECIVSGTGETPAPSDAAFWWNCKYNTKGQLAKNVEKTRQHFVSVFEKAGVTNPGQAWKRAKDYAQEMAFPAPELTEAEALAIEQEVKDETEKRGGKKDLFTRFEEELVILYKAGTATVNDEIIQKHPKSTEIKACLVCITNGLDALGFDRASLDPE